MGRVRVRWRSAGKAALALAAGLAALQTLPGLLKAPEAPPLAADVGLQGLAPTPREPTIEIREPPEPPAPKLKPKLRPSPGLSAATAVIGTTPRPRDPKRVPPPATPEPPPPAPPPTPEPVPALPPEPAPPPSDGSVEFAPH